MTLVFHYFAYGSNMNLTSLKAKGVKLWSSQRATLQGWKLLFNVHHWFRHEGGVGNIHRTDDPADQVCGLVYLCEDQHLRLLDAVESYGVGYDRIAVELETARGRLRAITYVGIPSYLDDRCLPTRRYINILLQGAISAGLDGAYIEELRRHPVHPEKDYPPFRHPPGPVQEFDAETLAIHPLYTALAGAVFDMKDARCELHCLKELFGGKDMTLFHLKRLDTSDGSETLDAITHGRIAEDGRKYLNAYLHEYDAEFRYVGRYVYENGLRPFFRDHPNVPSREGFRSAEEQLGNKPRAPIMSEFPDAMPHGLIEEVFPDVFFVTGTTRNEFFGATWQFSRNMTVVREGDRLTIVNSVRLYEPGLAALDALGKVVHVVRIGDMHGLDDPFYVDRYGATFWALPRMRIQDGLCVDKELTADGEMPFGNCSLFEFKTASRPEGILRLQREGGIMIACDSLQNWVEPDKFFLEDTVRTMREMGFFARANLGLAWRLESNPQAKDFVRLKEVSFRHALCGHGSLLRDTARENYHATFASMLGV